MGVIPEGVSSPTSEKLKQKSMVAKQGGMFAWWLWTGRLDPILSMVVVVVIIVVIVVVGVGTSKFMETNGRCEPF